MDFLADPILCVHLYIKDGIFISCIYSLKIQYHALFPFKICLMNVMTKSSTNRSSIFLEAPALPVTPENHRADMVFPAGAQQSLYLLLCCLVLLDT